ncbi:hypothetical protein [Stutzerimonas kunmingensis]|uniref:hypothetical protein n=1 Tax=Stutzerimonas kunmingensis TaxID=1211807 RepID=UPI002FCBA5A4
MADIAAFGLLRSRVALAEQLRLTLSYQACFGATSEHLDDRQQGFSPSEIFEIFGSSTAIVD